MRPLHVILIALVLVTPVFSEGQASSPYALWRSMARLDAETALALIDKNHPGAAPELKDKTFRLRMATARQHVRERLPKVTDFAGYSALISGLASDFQDGHIWSLPLISSSVTRWAGIVPERKDGAWFVAAQETRGSEPNLLHAEILSCDGVPFDSFAKMRIRLFAGNAELETVLIDQASNLLIDNGNPFIHPPQVCTFRRQNKAVPMTLLWSSVLCSHLKDLSRELSSSGNVPDVDPVLPVPYGYWITLHTLEPEAQKVIDEVQKEHARLHTAKTVVLDLRGNGGGDSEYAVKLANLLVGQPRVLAASLPSSPCTGEYWRATWDNLHSLQSSLLQASQNRSSQEITFYATVIRSMETALADGQRFAPALPKCVADLKREPPVSPTPKLPDSLMRGTLVLMTDHHCFSSCLIAVDLFRRLGAFHVGETTDMSTRYMEVREITLPSGLRTFSTLQKVALGVGDFGPYKPQLIYHGDIRDTAQLRSWVGTILPGRSTVGLRLLCTFKQ